MKRLLQLYFLLFLSFLGEAETLVVPPGTENQDGNAAGDFPFSRIGNIRSQQIYSPSLFPVLPSPGSFYEISEMAFRLDGNGPDSFGRTVNFERVQILISTGTGPFTIHTLDIDRNHGPNEITVYDSPTTLTGFVPAGNVPAAFDLRFPFSTPYVYNPNNGSLIIEIRKAGGTTGADILPGLDASRDSRFFFYYGTTSGTLTETYDTFGLVTRFTYEIVPEASPTIIASVGAVLLLVHSLIRKRICH